MLLLLLLLASWTPCSSEGEVCEFSGMKQVRYGVDPVWVTKIFEDGVDCNNGVFGDPLVGAFKACEFAELDAGTDPPPPLGVTTKAAQGQNVWTDGANAWVGSPLCRDAGIVLSTSSGIDAGEFIPGLHCPTQGFSRVPDCVEWFGAAPDIGSCEYVPIEFVFPNKTKPPIGVLTVGVIP